ncbi:thioesterase [Hoylesella loescheii]|uniref:thioesterase n=1 Tax=Hoylesella loescheii TaxID=840 RepID=UPI0009DB2B21|nr:thioesterase [Hoylesella loescheii]
MLSGMLFQLNWNAVPTYLEQGSILAITMRELKKLTTRAYRARCERRRLEGRRVSCWR